MNKKVMAATAAFVLPIGLLVSTPATEADAAAPARSYSNCRALNKVYPHGVARPGARDRVRGKTKPVRNFKISKRVYDKNRKLDRDRDGVACEQR